MTSCAPAVEPVDGGVGIVGRFAVAHIARVQWLGSAFGDDLRGPTVSAPDMAEQLLECPVRAGRHGRRRVRTADQFAECLGLLEQGCSEVHAHELTAVRAFPSVIGSVDHPRSTRVSRRLPPPASRASGKRSKNVRSPTSPFGAGQCGAQAEVPAAGERQVLARVVALDVEAVRIVEHLRVTVGPGEIEDHELAAPDHGARDVDVPRAIRALSCTGESSRRISSTASATARGAPPGCRGAPGCPAASEFRCPAG